MINLQFCRRNFRFGTLLPKPNTFISGKSKVFIMAMAHVINPLSASRCKGIGWQKCANFQVSMMKTVSVSSDVQVPMRAVTQQTRNLVT